MDTDLTASIPCATCGLPARPQRMELKSHDSRTGIRERDEWVAFYLCQNDHLTGRDGEVYTGPTPH